MERKQKKEKMNQYYMKKFSKNKNNQNKKIEKDNDNKKNKNKKSKNIENKNKNKKKDILFDDDQIDISDMNLEKIENKKIYRNNYENNGKINFIIFFKKYYNFILSTKFIPIKSNK